MSRQYGVKWNGRSYDPNDWQTGDKINRCLSAANSCLYGITEAAIIAAGYSPAIGFLHTGKPRSFVYDIADIIKFSTVTHVAFRVAKTSKSGMWEREVRMACRDSFRKSKLLTVLIPLINEILDAGGINPPEAYEDAQPPAIPEAEGFWDVGIRGG